MDHSIGCYLVTGGKDHDEDADDANDEGVKYSQYEIPYQNISAGPPPQSLGLLHFSPS